MGVSMRDCKMIAAQIGADFYVRHEAGKSKAYHVVLDGNRSDFRVLNDAYEYMSNVSLAAMYGDWIIATTAEDEGGLTDSDIRTLKKAKSILNRWTLDVEDDESVDYMTYAVAIDATSNIYEFLLRYEEMVSDGREHVNVIQGA